MVPCGLALREVFRQHGPRGPEENGPDNRVSPVPPAHNRAVCMRTAFPLPPIPPAQNRRYAHFITQGICRAASFYSQELICRYIALAGGLDGTLAITRMKPCFRVAVRIATVVAARPRGGCHGGRLAFMAGWAG